jgi:GIY-YIG catalytic domain-containing protein
MPDAVPFIEIAAVSMSSLGVDGPEPFVSWLEHPTPWEIKGQLILELRPPLNLAENSHHSFYPELSQLRRQVKARARSLSVMPNGFSQ